MYTLYMYEYRDQYTNTGIVQLHRCTGYCTRLGYMLCSIRNYLVLQVSCYHTTENHARLAVA